MQRIFTCLFFLNIIAGFHQVPVQAFDAGSSKNKIDSLENQLDAQIHDMLLAGFRI